MGFRERVWGVSWVYQLNQGLVWRKGSLGQLVADAIRPFNGCKILDLGCGPADIFSRLGDVDYLGIDNNPKYIETARARFGSRAEFHCWDATDTRLTALGKFDIVLIMAVLHHLDDFQVHTLLNSATAVLKHAGHLVSIDPVFDEGQHPIARWLARLDRGRYVRTTERYGELISRHFTPQQIVIRHDLLRVPYTQCIFVAKHRDIYPMVKIG